MDTRGNASTDPEWVKKLKPGWQQRRNYNFTSILTGAFVEEDLVGDSWTSLFKLLGNLVESKDRSSLADHEMAVLGELVDFQKMNEVRSSD